MKKKLFLMFFTLFLTMCRSSTLVQPFRDINGLTCRTGTANEVVCSYACPNGETVDFDTDPSFSATEGDLDRLYCGIVPATFTPVATLVNSSQTPVETPTLQAATTATATIAISSTSGSPLLTGRVTMCDTGSNLISFRIVTPAPDLTGKTLTVVIADQESSCTVNPTNTSVMTCTIPPSVTFPAQVVVSLDGAVVNDFTHEGIGCTQITTPVTTTTP